MKKIIIKGEEIPYLADGEKGEIFSNHSKKYLKSKMDRYGYCAVTVYTKGTKLSKTVHSLVAGAYLGERGKNVTVNHKDGDKTNNRIDNLELVTHSKNTSHAYATGLKSPSDPQVVTQMTLEGRHVRTYPTIAEAARATGVNRTKIISCCTGKRNSAGGYAWATKEPPKRTGLALPVEAYLNNVQVGVFASVSECASELNVCRTGISRVLKGKQSLCGGYFFKTTDDIVQ